MLKDITYFVVRNFTSRKIGGDQTEYETLFVDIPEIVVLLMWFIGPLCNAGWDPFLSMFDWKFRGVFVKSRSAHKDNIPFEIPVVAVESTFTLS